MPDNITALVFQKFKLSRLSLLVILCGSMTAFALTAQTAYAGPGMSPAGTSRGGYAGEATRSYGSTGAWVKTLQQSFNMASKDYADPFANTPYDLFQALSRKDIGSLCLPREEVYAPNSNESSGNAPGVYCVG
ncbi:MAG: hypothetical protein E6J34_12575 [Chloroflexi bacterium]|nr:MAG: hypothetical protein E6J34_12575 [Chloroflexota bacterium]